MTIAHGHQVSGVQVTSTKMQGVSSLDQLEAYGLIRPTKIENLTKRDARDNPADASAKRLRENVQRPFDKMRKDNAQLYAEYLKKSGEQGELGGVPAITLFVPPEANAAIFENGVLIPYNQAIVALDGETQTEARFILRDNMLPESGTWPLAITFYVGISYDQAKQIVHDYNTLANPMSELKTATLNAAGPMSRAASQLYLAAGITADEVNRFGTGPTKKHKLANRQLMAAIAGYAMPEKGLKGNISNDYKLLNMPQAEHNINGAGTSLVPFVTSSLAVSAKAAPAVWQVAGALVANKRQAGDLNWSGGIKAYEDTKSGGRGGPRMAVAERMKAIASGLAA